MKDRSIVVRHFARIMFAKGVIASICGVVALAQPESLLLVAALVTTIVLALTGAYELGLSVRNRDDNRGWPLAAADGAACVGMALITVSITAIPLHYTVLLGALGLALGGTAALLLALAVWPMRRTRLAMLSWSIVQLGLSWAALIKEPELFTLLYAGAAYVIGFGVFQIVSSLWLLRVAVPQIGPTVQESWG